MRKSALIINIFTKGHLKLGYLQEDSERGIVALFQVQILTNIHKSYILLASVNNSFFPKFMHYACLLGAFMQQTLILAFFLCHYI